jgi:hypothetical protein
VLCLLGGLGTDLLCLLGGLGTDLLRHGGATAYLLSLVLGTTRGRDLGAQRVDRVADNAARPLI